MKTNDGQKFTAEIFIDASYEGDLMAMANVTYTTCREPKSKYNESLGGSTFDNSGNKFILPVNPYDENGNLIPLL